MRDLSGEGKSSFFNQSLPSVSGVDDCVRFSLSLGANAVLMDCVVRPS